MSRRVGAESLTAGGDLRFTQIWHRYYPRLIVFVRALGTVPPEEIEDAVQEIMVKIFKNLHRYRRIYALSTWVYAIARNHCRDVGRSLARHPRTQSYTEERHPGTESTPRTPEEALLRDDTRRAVRGALEALPPALKQVAFLRFHEGMRLKDISRTLDTPLGTIKYHLHELRKSVRARLMETGHAGT